MISRRLCEEHQEISPAASATQLSTAYWATPLRMQKPPRRHSYQQHSLSDLRRLGGSFSAWAITLAALALIGFYISYTLRSSGTYQDDDIGHFLIARWSWRHPELLLDVWGRPTFTLLYAPIAPLGLTAARIESAVLAGLVCIGSALLAQAYGLRWYWLAVPLTGLQPEFVRQGFATLTELSFALCLCVALIAYKRQHWALMALAAGWLPLARYEAIPILALFVFMLARERHFGLCLVALAPLLLWNSYWAIAADDWRRLLFPFSGILFEPGRIATDYGSGPLWYYPSRLPVVFGTVCFVLATHGFFRLRFGMLQLCTIIVVGVLSISYWKLPATGIAGYIRHLAVLAPVVGVLALAGIELLAFPPASRLARWLVGGAMLGAGLAAAGFALVAWRMRAQIYADGAVALLVGGLIGLQMVTAKPPLLTPLQPEITQAQGRQKTRSFRAFLSWRSVGFTRRLLAATCVPIIAVATATHIAPFQLNDEQQLVIGAAAWYNASPYRGRVVLGAHTWFAYASGLDIGDRSIYRMLTPAEIEQAPVGSIVVWDSHYSPRLSGATPLSKLENTPRFRRLQTYQSAGFVFNFYEKVAP